MILCVTLNSCLDKTLVVPAWKPGHKIRGLGISEVVGGKGNNVARALTRLGRSAKPTTFLGGPIGDHCAFLLHELDGFDPLVIRSEAPTRTILTVKTEDSNEQTAFFDPSPEITHAEAEAMIREVERVVTQGDVEAITLSGSSPSESTDGLYLDLISVAQSRRIPVFLDTYGPALKSIWGFWPEVIQLNRDELARHLEVSDPSDDQVIQQLGDWIRHGVRFALVTDGPNPALICTEDKVYKAYPPEIDLVNPVGSGDSTLAGVVQSWLEQASVDEMIRNAMACGASNAETWDAGAIDPTSLVELRNAVEIELLDKNPMIEPPDSSGDSTGFLRVGVYGRPTNRFGRR